MLRKADFGFALPAALAAALPRAELAIVAGAGHMVHAESPRAFADQVQALRRRGERGGRLLARNVRSIIEACAPPHGSFLS